MRLRKKGSIHERGRNSTHITKHTYYVRQEVQYGRKQNKQLDKLLLVEDYSSLHYVFVTCFYYKREED